MIFNRTSSSNSLIGKSRTQRKISSNNREIVIVVAETEQLAVIIITLTITIKLVVEVMLDHQLVGKKISHRVAAIQVETAVSLVIISAETAEALHQDIIIILAVIVKKVIRDNQIS